MGRSLATGLATRFGCFALGIALLAGCSCSDPKQKPTTDAAVSDGDVQSDAQGLGDGGTNPFDTNDAGQILCGDVACQCSDGIDNDDDDDVDGTDVECTGPADNDESSFATGVPGDNKDPFWQDCFYDGNSGAGDDRCRYRTECLTGELPLTDKDCKVTQKCVDNCRPLTPNGCDCFGCCDVTFADDTTKAILISAPCDADDPSGCTECVKSTQCDNDCGECELCAGKTAADLPDSCNDDYTCDDGQTLCPSGTNEECPADYSCTFGCCVPVIISPV